MELEPKIRGKKTKSIRVEAADLKLLREELKATKEWARYADAADSELVRLAVMFARLHLLPDVFVLTTEAVQTLVDEAVRLSIADVAGALGGVAQLNRDRTINVARMDGDPIETFKTTPVAFPRTAVLH